MTATETHRESATPVELGADLLAVVARLNRAATMWSGMSIPYAQARLLAQIEDRGWSRISELAAADHCSQPTMTTQVQRLEAAGWATRRPDPTDARAVLVATTPAGQEALTVGRGQRAAAVAPHLAALDDHERRTLADAVQIMRRVLASASDSYTSEE